MSDSPYKKLNRFYETVHTEECLQISRYEVPNGWIYEKRYQSPLGHDVAVSTTFVPYPPVELKGTYETVGVAEGVSLI